MSATDCGESRQPASASCCGAEGAATPPHAFPPENLPAGPAGSAGPFLWTEENTETLRRMLVDRVSASQAAIVLSKEFHRPVTKNMVIGRCWRAGIGLPLARVSWHPADPTPNPFPKDLAGCLWPYGHPSSPGFRFCGGHRVPGKPYCAIHAAVCYVRDKVEVA